MTKERCHHVRRMNVHEHLLLAWNSDRKRTKNKNQRDTHRTPIVYAIPSHLSTQGCHAFYNNSLRYAGELCGPNCDVTIIAGMAQADVARNPRDHNGVLAKPTAWSGPTTPIGGRLLSRYMYEVAPDLRGHKAAGRVVGIQVIQKI